MFTIRPINEDSKQKVPLKVWLKDEAEIEGGALEQAMNLTMLPFVRGHVALMPDCHLGYGVPIGCVFGAENVVIPNAVGVDIGCGMASVETNVPVEEFLSDRTLIKKIRENFKKVVPVGYKHHKEQQVASDELSELLDNSKIPIVNQECDRALYQLGTLGGGNHFIEIQASDRGTICLMVHSGSRNFGKKIADVYNNKAKELNKRWFTGVDEKMDLAFLPIDSEEGREYLDAMNIALVFAMDNRTLMMERIKNVFFNMISKYMRDMKYELIRGVNIHHNYATLENIFGKNLWVHRKGATSARAGEYGIIPGSQGTASYIVEGLGNTESLRSCSHGAGRRMGRMQATRTLDKTKCDQMMAGIEYDDWGKIQRGKLKGKVDLSEAPLAYKDIDKVMEDQQDLVKVITKLRPLGVIKG